MARQDLTRGHPSSGTLRGAGFMLVSTASIAIDAALIRVTSAELHPFEIAFFRNLFSLVLVLPWLLRAGPEAWRTQAFGLHLLRAALKLAALCSLFYAISLMPLAEVTAIAFTAPLFVALGGGLLLGERLRAVAWAAILVGFGGVLIVLRPGSALFDPVILAAIAAALGQAGIILVLKFLTRTEPTVRLVGLNLALSVLLGSLIAIPVWTWPSPFVLLLLAAQGALGALGQTCTARALSLADASVIMPVEFMRLPLVVLIAWLAFDEPGQIWTWVGGAVIFGATFVLVRSSRAGTDATAAPAGARR
jgi:drug/metabolite transporter (DMT)-like permease